MRKIEYEDGIEVLMTRSPKHPLLASLLVGYSPANVLYLRYALKNLPPDQPADASPVATVEDQGLLFQKSRLFGQRASLSNKMLDLPEDATYDKQRARYSDQICEVQRQIEALMASGGSAMINEPAHSNLPTDKAGLITKRQSIRSALSRARKQEKADLVKHYENLLSDVQERIDNNR